MLTVHPVLEVEIEAYTLSALVAEPQWEPAWSGLATERD